MNVALYGLAKIRGKEKWFDAYRRMLDISQRLLLKNLGGLNKIVESPGPDSRSMDWVEFLRDWYESAKLLQGLGHNVLFIGADTVLSRPVDFNWDPGHMVMPMDNPGEGYRCAAGMILPYSMDPDLWKIGDEEWTRVLAMKPRHDPDQLIYNAMYRSQPGVDVEADLGFNGCPAKLGEATAWNYLSASRDPARALREMEEVSK